MEGHPTYWLKWLTACPNFSLGYMNLYVHLSVQWFLHDTRERKWFWEEGVGVPSVGKTMVLIYHSPPVLPCPRGPGSLASHPPLRWQSSCQSWKRQESTRFGKTSMNCTNSQLIWVLIKNWVAAKTDVNLMMRSEDVQTWLWRKAETPFSYTSSEVRLFFINWLVLWLMSGDLHVFFFLLFTIHFLIYVLYVK